MDNKLKKTLNESRSPKPHFQTKGVKGLEDLDRL